MFPALKVLNFSIFFLNILDNLIKEKKSEIEEKGRKVADITETYTVDGVKRKGKIGSRRYILKSKMKIDLDTLSAFGRISRIEV